MGLTWLGVMVVGFISGLGLGRCQWSNMGLFVPHQSSC